MARIRNEALRKAYMLPSLLLGTCAAACLLPTSALAISLPNPLPDNNPSPFACSGRAIEPAARIAAGDGGVTNKSAAILGGQPSALDLIRQQQSGLHTAAEPALPPATILHSTIAVPGTCLVANGLGAGIPRSELATVDRSADFLGSARVGIKRTPLNDEWQRVSAPHLSRTRVDALIGTAAESSVATLSLVNQWANQRIEFVNDYENNGTRDYWATAEETLASGVGDCEDYAILKYQILSALGFDRSEMFLTLARDLVRNADHAVLVVRIGGRNYMLDNATDIVLPADRSYDYRPTISFNSETAWLHGYSGRSRAATPIAPRSFAYRSDSALSSALVTGLSR